MVREFESQSQIEILPRQTRDVRAVPDFLYTGVEGSGKIIRRTVKVNGLEEHIYDVRELSDAELIKTFNHLKEAESLRDDPEFRKKFSNERIVTVDQYISEGITDYETELRTGSYAKEAHGIFFPVIAQSLFKNKFNKTMTSN